MNEVFGDVYIVVEFPFVHLRPSVWALSTVSYSKRRPWTRNATEEGLVGFAESEHDVAVVAAAGEGRLVASFSTRAAMRMLLGGRVGASVPRTRTDSGTLAENQPVLLLASAVRAPLCPIIYAT